MTPEAVGVADPLSALGRAQGTAEGEVHDQVSPDFSWSYFLRVSHTSLTYILEVSSQTLLTIQPSLYLLLFRIKFSYPSKCCLLMQYVLNYRVTIQVV